MYYPYLRGKQFELLALRDFAPYYGANGRVIPIIEPVKASFNSMRLAIKGLQQQNIKFALILNPQVGELIGQIKLIESALESDLKECTSWMPAFIIHNNYDQLQKHIEEKRYTNVLLILRKNSGSDEDKVISLATKNYISSIVIDPAYKSIKRKLHRAGKQVIRLDDNFEPQARNSDYIDIQEELFSEEYRYYADEGFDGISDYTVLPSAFIEGGRLPYAIAIHMTYEKNDDHIFIRHFVSDTNDDSSNIQKKFGEAASKTVAFFNQIHKSNYAIKTLQGYCEAGQYPGLGMIKKISILNHLELMAEVLNA